ncbi:MAG: efflux RND transporter permease subunit, partial [Acidobacteriota bacterium]
DEAAEIARQALATVAQVTDIATTSEPGSPEVQVTLDRDRASALGVTASEIGNALRRKIRGDIVGEFREGEERIDIRLRALEMFRDQASEVQDLRLRLDDGTAVPVSALARIEVGRGPAAIYRADGARMAEITAQVLGDDLGAVLDDVRATMAAVDVPVTANVQMSGQDEELAVSFNSLKLAVALAIFLVYVVMASQFESLLHPFVILMSVPLALVGVVASLFVTNNALSVLAMIGAVMLAGIVVNNAIVLVDAINRRRREGESLRDAVIGAGGERLRPILMTTATTVLGLLPMALGLGAGDELRAPLAITVIGGLAVATVLTLVVIPCIYVAVTREPLDGGAAKSRSTSTPERDPELDTDDERVLPAASVAT